MTEVTKDMTRHASQVLCGSKGQATLKIEIHFGGAQSECGKPVLVANNCQQVVAKGVCDML